IGDPASGAVPRLTQLARLGTLRRGWLDSFAEMGYAHNPRAGRAAPAPDKGVRMAEPSHKRRSPGNWAAGGRPDPLVRPPVERGPQGPLHPVAFADRMAARECLRAPGWSDEGAEPFSLQWYLDIESARHRRAGKWVPRLLEFSKHPGERVLGLGFGLGTDW